MQKIPSGVKIISILIILLASWLIVSNIISLVEITQKGVLGSIDESRFQEYKLRFENRGMNFNENNLFRIFMIGFAFMFLIGILFLIVGIKLWQGAIWARIIIVAIAFTITLFSFISVIMGSILGFLEFGISFLIGLYLLLNKKVRIAFKK